MIPVRRLNHAVLRVRDLDAAVTFYSEAFGFEVVAREPRMPGAFLRAAGSANHHDLGLFEVGGSAPPAVPGGVGLYHLAWEVGDVADLVTARETLRRLGAYTGESDHGATKSIYGVDPDGNELEVMWMVPRELWGDDEHRAPVRPLDLDGEVQRHG